MSAPRASDNAASASPDAGAQARAGAEQPTSASRDANDPGSGRRCSAGAMMGQPLKPSRISDEMFARLGPQVLAIIYEHVGQQQAITSRALAQSLGLHGKYDDRKVRAVIRELVIRQGLTIAASDGSPRGYWWIASADEARKYLAELKQLNLSIWVRFGAFSHAAYRRFGIPVEQLRLDL